MFAIIGPDNSSLKQAATIEETIAIVSSILMIIKVHKKNYPRFRGLILATAICGIVAPPANLILSVILIWKIYLHKTNAPITTPPTKDESDVNASNNNTIIPGDINAD